MAVSRKAPDTVTGTLRRLKSQAVIVRMLLVGMIAASAVAQEDDPAEDSAVARAIDERIEAIGRDRGLTVHWRYTPDFIPIHWKNRWTGSPASVEQAQKMVALCEKWLATWPQDLTKVIKGVYIFDWLAMDGIRGVCIEYDFNLYMSSNMSDGDLLCRFFHEATHCLTRAVPLDANKWSATLPEGIRYVGDEASRDNPMQFGEEWYRKGFLYKYSQSCADEEIAIIAQYLFTDPQQLKELMKQYPALRNRVVLAMDYFTKLSDRIDFSTFDDM